MKLHWLAKEEKEYFTNTLGVVHGVQADEWKQPTPFRTAGSKNKIPKDGPFKAGSTLIFQQFSRSALRSAHFRTALKSEIQSIEWIAVNNYSHRMYLQCYNTVFQQKLWNKENLPKFARPETALCLQYGLGYQLSVPWPKQTHFAGSLV